METKNLTKLIEREVELAPIPLTGRYPEAALRKEMIKGSLGLAGCLGVLIALNPTPWIAWPIWVVAGLFSLYLIQQGKRFPLRFQLDEAGVTRLGGKQRQVIRWNALEDLRLNFYPNGRKAATGTLVLVLGLGRDRFKVDSSLDHFPTLLSRSAQAARERGLELHPTTVANLEKLGL